MEASRTIVAGELTLESFKRQNGVREVRRPFGNQPKRRSFQLMADELARHVRQVKCAAGGGEGDCIDGECVVCPRSIGAR